MSQSFSSSGYQNKAFYPDALEQKSSLVENNHQRHESSTPLVEEIPLAITIHDITYAVMMITPIDVKAFVIGFVISEAIVDTFSEIRDIHIRQINTSPNINTLSVNVEVSPRRLTAFKKNTKARLGATGCGLCGVESLTQAIPNLTSLKPSSPIKSEDLITLRSSLFEHQVLGNKTGAIHAAMLLSPQNDILCCMEDIGRHNALDKIIGYAYEQNISLHNHTVLMSSRCSAELVQKAVRVGLSRLVHLASPSTLAVNLALHYGLTLIHLPKKDSPRVFAPLSSTTMKSEPEAAS